MFQHMKINSQPRSHRLKKIRKWCRRPRRRMWCILRLIKIELRAPFSRRKSNRLGLNSSWPLRNFGKGSKIRNRGRFLRKVRSLKSSNLRSRSRWWVNIILAILRRMYSNNRFLIMQKSYNIRVTFSVRHRLQSRVSHRKIIFKLDPKWRIPPANLIPLGPFRHRFWRKIWLEPGLLTTLIRDQAFRGNRRNKFNPRRTRWSRQTASNSLRAPRTISP